MTMTMSRVTSFFTPSSSSFNDTERLMRNIGDHPLLERVQQALYTQLSSKYDAVSAELRDRTEEVARAATEREDIGVELYGVQQQLAKLQMQLETASGNMGVVAEVRQKVDADAAQFRQVRSLQGSAAHCPSISTSTS
jgi:uncharacterized protein (DUF3084 family)